MQDPSLGNTGTTTVLRRIREDGGEESWESFVRRYWRVIHGYATGAGLESHFADDLTQSVLIELIGILPTFEVDKRVGNFRSLLRTIVKRRVIDHFRKSSRENGAMHGFVEAAALPESDPPDELFERVWRDELMRAAIEGVRQRSAAVDFQAFDLIANGGVPGAEVARMLGISKASAYQAKSRVSKAIRDEMDQMDREAR